MAKLAEKARLAQHADERGTLHVPDLAGDRPGEESGLGADRETIAVTPTTAHADADGVEVSQANGPEARDVTATASAPAPVPARPKEAPAREFQRGTANTVLHIDDVHKSFAGLHALSDVDLDVREGETHAIIGPNGAGKSTLLNVCVGRLKPDRGAVVFDGHILTGKTPHEINQIGVARVFQTPEVFPELSVIQNVMVPALSKRDGAFRLNPFVRFSREKHIREEAADVLASVGMHARHDDEAASLSRGDKRRLELAMGLIQHPRLLLLDEPTAGMARADTNATIDLLKQIKERGMTKVIIEHDMHVVFSLADRISVLAGGRIIAQGTPEEIKNDPRVKEAYLGEEQVG